MTISRPFARVAVVLACLATASSARAQAVRAEGPYFRDEAGAVVLLRGLNVAGDAKVPPFRPIDDARLLDPLPSWGVNVARLLFTWEAVEAERGRYDETYFTYYREVIDALHARGVWVIVDVHQDAFSRYATDGCGEGMPAWAVSPAVTRDEPDNGPNCSSWGIKFILDTDTHRCWDDFYADAHGVRTRYLALLDELARRFADHPAVIGYDMLNEPWGDEGTQIGPLYEDAARVLRARDPDAMLFTSPQALTSAGQDTKLAPPSYTNAVYSPHFYDGSVVTLHTWPGGSLKDPVERMVRQAAVWNVPLLVGEFGAPGDGVNVQAYMDAFYAELDARFVSATQWSFVAHWTEQRKDGWNTEDFSIQGGDGTLRPTYRIRPYPARIAGEPLSFAVTRDPALTVELRWTHEPSLGATRIFAPRTGLFESELTAETSDALRCELEWDARHVRCSALHAGEMRVLLRACADGEPCLPVAEPPPERAPTSTSDAGQAAGPASHASNDASVVGALDAGTSTWSPAANERDRAGCAAHPLPRGRASCGWLLALLALGRVRRRQT